MGLLEKSRNPVTRLGGTLLYFTLLYFTLLNLIYYIFLLILLNLSQQGNLPQPIRKNTNVPPTS